MASVSSIARDRRGGLPGQHARRPRRRSRGWCAGASRPPTCDDAGCRVSVAARPQRLQRRGQLARRRARRRRRLSSASVSGRSLANSRLSMMLSRRPGRPRRGASAAALARLGQRASAAPLGRAVAAASSDAAASSASSSLGRRRRSARPSSSCRRRRACRRRIDRRRRSPGAWPDLRVGARRRLDGGVDHVSSGSSRLDGSGAASTLSSTGLVHGSASRRARSSSWQLLRVVRPRASASVLPRLSSPRSASARGLVASPRPAVDVAAASRAASSVTPADLA